MLDQKLTFKKQIEYTIKKSGKSVRMLYSLFARSSKLHVRNKLLLFISIIRPQLTYAPSIIQQAAATNKHQLQLYQNRILKMCMNKPKRYSSNQLHLDAKIEQMNQFIDRLALRFEFRTD